MTKESDQFEKELEDFFQDRALFRTASVSDPTKKIVKQTRNEDEKITFLQSQQTMSGCCMTGCHDCPWGYRP